MSCQGIHYDAPSSLWRLMRQTHFPSCNRRRKKATTDWHPPPYLGITSSRCVSSMVLAGEHDQKGSSFTRKQTLKKYKVVTDLHWSALMIPMPTLTKLVEVITEKLRHSAPDAGCESYCFTRRRRKKATTVYHPPPLK